MAITITPVTQAPSTSVSTEQSPAQSARAKAMAAFAGSQNAQGSPVPNPSSISPEESLAVKSEVTGNQTASSEDTTSEEAPLAQKEEPISSQYAILARKEKALRAQVAKQEQSIKAREAALQAREAELTSKSTFDSSKYVSIDELKRDAFGSLSKHGISYDEISQQALASQSPEAQMFRQMRDELNAELQKVREEQANNRTAQEQQQAKAYQNALNQIRSEASQLVSSDPSFETIKETGSVSDVVDLIERTFKEEGRLLTVEAAAQEVEDYLVEEAAKLLRIKKIQSKYGTPAAKPVENKQTASVEEAKNNLKTLTNAVGNTRPLSAKERALLAFKGEKF